MKEFLRNKAQSHMLQSVKVYTRYKLEDYGIAQHRTRPL
jgi:hypothetical protein